MPEPVWMSDIMGKTLAETGMNGKNRQNSTIRPQGGGTRTQRDQPLVTA
jgi:hypothetical protein